MGVLWKKYGNYLFLLFISLVFFTDIWKTYGIMIKFMYIKWKSSNQEIPLLFSDLSIIYS